ncbi:MAG: penicillin acylase family protein, partial [Pseudomonadota bacterium]
MRGFLVALGAFIVAALIAAATWLWTPSSKSFDTQAALEAAAQYSADVIRDDFGVPHIYGEKNADVAFGLAYAHAEDDWATFEDVILFTRGDLAQRDGRSGAITDYLVAALGVKDTVDKKYSSDLSTGTRAIIEAYAAGANYFCATHEGVCAPGIAPVTYADVAGGFVARQPFFYGLDDELTTLLSPPETNEETAQSSASADKRYATNLQSSVDTVFHLTGGGEFGSNAIAISPKRSADGATRLMVNSHQPYTGPVAWYEARLKSEEGWDGIGGFFPGSPFILHGALPKLAWAFTVNKPDLVDVYDLEVDREKNPDRYRFDGEWRDFDVGYAEFRVKLWGPLSLPVKRRILRSVHGPVFETPNGWKAVAFAGDGTITAAEQYYQMNIAETYAEWRSAFEILGIPSLNAVYADDTGRIGYFYNAAIPVRDPDIDWTKPAPGDASSAVWSGVRSFGEVPQVVDPDSGFVGNANNSPFEASAQADVPRDADFPQEYGIDRRTSNRGDRLLDLYLADDSITEEEFIAYKMDTRYHEGGRVQESVE